MQVSDDLFLGGFVGQANFMPTSGLDPTLNNGVGPMGRTAYLNFIPLTLQPDNIAALQHTVASTALVLTAGTGITTGLAPDGSGRTIYILDSNRALSLTSTANLSGMNFTVTGFDLYGRVTTARRAGPNNNTVNFTKAMKSIISVVPSATDASNNVSVGTSDVFGLQYAVPDAGYLIPKWAETLAIDAGTFVAADATTATATTGDPRGTYTPSSASNGTRRLVVWMHVAAPGSGPNATVAGAIGVTPA